MSQKIDKSDRFKKVAERRTRAALNAIRLLGNCGNTNNYTYTDQQVRKIFGEVDEAIKVARSRFRKNIKREFSL